mmetsp:Transcript_30311/g.84714  ORF Transcript_30311/g.84714 Transcript_30311/m.84714 type:complete len:243 (-) Transcript_30311:1140-1868(-)
MESSRAPRPAVDGGFPAGPGPPAGGGGGPGGGGAALPPGGGGGGGGPPESMPEPGGDAKSGWSGGEVADFALRGVALCLRLAAARRRRCRACSSLMSRSVDFLMAGFFIGSAARAWACSPGRRLLGPDPPVPKLSASSPRAAIAAMAACLSSSKRCSSRRLRYSSCISKALLRSASRSLRTCSSVDSFIFFRNSSRLFVIPAAFWGSSPISFTFAFAKKGFSKSISTVGRAPSSARISFRIS